MWFVGMWVIESFVVLWILYIPFANLLRWDISDYPKPKKYLAYGYMTIFAILDVTCNFIPASIAFWKLPPVNWSTLTIHNLEHLTLTDRLIVYLDAEATAYKRGEFVSWRFRRLCGYANIYLNLGNKGHCGVVNMGIK